MKLTKTNLVRMYKEEQSDLKKVVLEYVIDKWSEYDNKESIFTDVLYYGCQSGIVTSLIYYSDTTKFYNAHKEEINELLYNALFNFGTNNPKDIFGDKWDEEDPLALDTYNQNLLAWFGFEETLRDIAYNFEELEEKI